MSILKSHSKHEDSLTGPFHKAKAKLEQLQADAKRKGIEIAGLTALALTKRNIDRRLEDLKKTHASNRARARAEIAAAVTAFLVAVEVFGNDSTTSSAEK